MRKYIQSERSNLFEPNVYISMVVKLEGKIKAEDVAEAVETAYAANEATMSQIVLEENGAAFYDKREKSGCRVIFDNRNWKEIIRDGEKKPFELRGGELIRTYIATDEQNITLLIHAHHLVGDGKAVLLLISDIVSVLAGEQLTYKPMILVDKAYLEKRSRLLPGVSLALSRANQKWKMTGRTFSWDDYYRIHKAYWEEYSSDIEIKTYNAEELKKNCKKGVTLNSYLITQLLKEYPESKVVGIPINIRENVDTMSNMTSAIALSYQYKPRKSFEENLLRIHKKIYRRLQNTNLKYFVLLFIAHLHPTLVDAVLLQTHGCYQNPLSEKMARIMGYMGKGGRDLGVTNLTRIEILGDYEKFRVQNILFVPPKVSYTKKVIGISTYGNELTICCHEMRKTKTPVL